MIEKSRQTIYERAEIGEKVLHQLKQMLEGSPVEVLGHIESLATCCGSGTVAIVRVDLEQVTSRGE
jgi:hypothetical protein